MSDPENFCEDVSNIDCNLFDQTWQFYKSTVDDFPLKPPFSSRILATV
jgi:hypothetical protein